MSRNMKAIGMIGLCFALSLAIGSDANAQNSSVPGTDCKVPNVQQSPDKNTTVQPDSDITGSTTKLSDCGGVIKPPETGDGNLVQPSPPSSKMPVVRPNDLPSQQQNAK